ncbi:MAG TPA: excisionase [Actinomycetota bacterium]
MTPRQPPAPGPSSDDELPSLGGGADDAGHASVDWDRLISQLAEQPQEDGWVTLQEASSAAGVARSTLRSWYRAGHIPSRMVAGTHGPQRLVPLDAVVDRALQSSRARRQLEQARSLEAEVEDLRRRIRAIERHLGLDGT